VLIRGAAGPHLGTRVACGRLAAAARPAAALTWRRYWLLAARISASPPPFSDSQTPSLTFKPPGRGRPAA
jgi:hypothetical protein